MKNRRETQLYNLFKVETMIFSVCNNALRILLKNLDKDYPLMLLFRCQQNFPTYANLSFF